MSRSTFVFFLAAIALFLWACCHASDPKRLVGDCLCPCYDPADAGR